MDGAVSAAEQRPDPQPSNADLEVFKMSASWITQWLPVVVGVGWSALLVVAVAQA
jgi:hypothetical protein